jgi:hypothetical protein
VCQPKNLDDKFSPADRRDFVQERAQQAATVVLAAAVLRVALPPPKMAAMALPAAMASYKVLSILVRLQWQLLEAPAAVRWRCGGGGTAASVQVGTGATATPATGGNGGAGGKGG